MLDRKVVLKERVAKRGSVSGVLATFSVFAKRLSGSGSSLVADEKKAPALDEQSQRLLAALKQEVDNVLSIEGNSDVKAQLLERIYNQFKATVGLSSYQATSSQVQSMLKAHANHVAMRFPEAASDRYTAVYLQTVNDWIEELGKAVVNKRSP